MPGRTPGRALACLLLVLAALGIAAPTARAEVRSGGSATVVQDQGRTTTTARQRSATRVVEVSPTTAGDVRGAERQLGGVVLGAGASGGTSGSAGPVGVLPAAHRSLVPLLLGQLPRPPSSSYPSLLLSGSPSRAPPAVAGT
ncbi:MAG: hypothetical protein Q8R60_14680 [Mycobacteriales bacterium]|nr:hypothetical protein [Mycobacteriales bacterium]